MSAGGPSSTVDSSGALQDSDHPAWELLSKHAKEAAALDFVSGLECLPYTSAGADLGRGWEWVAFVAAPKGSAVEGGTYRVRLFVPRSYPATHPTLQFWCFLMNLQVRFCQHSGTGRGHA